MNHAPLQEQSLLVKTQPGCQRPFVLENLKTGHRSDFDSAIRLLEPLSEELGADPCHTRSGP